MMNEFYVSEGSRILIHSIRRKIQGHKRYHGSDSEICQQIIRDCWNGRYFQTSAGHFNEFYSRDFGWCAESLVKLGYGKQVQASLEYALRAFEKTRRVTTTITPKGMPFDFPTFAVDSLPWIIHGLATVKNQSLVERHRAFLELQIRIWARTVLGSRGLVRKDRFFSSIKDHAERRSSCYDNCCAGMLARDASALGLDNPLEKNNYDQLIRNTYWNGQYFFDDCQKKPYVAGDANIAPFWMGIISDKKIQTQAFQAMSDAGLDDPFPLRYTAKGAPVNFIGLSFLARDYERSAIWPHMGIPYIELLSKIDKRQAIRHVQSYRELIIKYQNFLEVFRERRPFSTLLYEADEGMLWSANYLVLKKDLNNQ